MLFKWVTDVMAFAVLALAVVGDIAVVFAFLGHEKNVAQGAAVRYILVFCILAKAVTTSSVAIAAVVMFL